MRALLILGLFAATSAWAGPSVKISGTVTDFTRTEYLFRDGQTIRHVHRAALPRKLDAFIEKNIGKPITVRVPFAARGIASKSKGDRK